MNIYCKCIIMLLDLDFYYLIVLFFILSCCNCFSRQWSWSTPHSVCAAWRTSWRIRWKVWDWRRLPWVWSWTCWSSKRRKSTRSRTSSRASWRTERRDGSDPTRSSPSFSSWSVTYLTLLNPDIISFTFSSMMFMFRVIWRSWRAEALKRFSSRNTHCSHILLHSGVASFQVGMFQCFSSGEHGHLLNVENLRI